jgi:AraC family transcriptional regulator
MPDTSRAPEWYRHGRMAAATHAIRSVPHETCVIQAGPVHLINVSPPAGRVVDEPVPEYSLNLLLDTAPLLRVGFNRPPRWLAVSPGAMVFTPPDTACEFIGESSAHVLAVAIPTPTVEAFAQDTGVRVDLREEEAFRDPHLVQQLVRLWHELSVDTPDRGLIADHVMRAVLDALATRSGSASRLSARAARERLTHRTVLRLRDYVEHSLADDLDVTAMAQVAGASPAHFARAFAATVGMTPFRYVMTRRLARARQLLELTRRPANTIAGEVGFKTPSHFAARFRREFGVPPTEIRSFRTVRPDAAG